MWEKLELSAARIHLKLISTYLKVSCHGNDRKYGFSFSEGTTKDDGMTPCVNPAKKSMQITLVSWVDHALVDVE